MSNQSIPTTRINHFIKSKVAERVSILNDKKETAKRNDELLNDQIHALSKLHGVSYSEIEQIFKNEIEQSLLKQEIKQNIASSFSKIGENVLIFIMFLLALAFVINWIIFLK